MSGIDFRPLCIWCQRSDHFTVEHIFPDALGCPPHFVLEIGVCRKCNGKNGRLDQALLKPFELATVLKGIPRKNGRPPTIDQHSTFASAYDQNGPALFFNRERFAVDTPLGRALGPTTVSDVIEKYEIQENDDGTVAISLNQKLIFDRSAVRGLFKIALELIAFREGLATAHSSEYDAVRRYVRYDEGEFFALCLYGGPFDHYLSNRYCDEKGNVAVPMTLLEVGFICDFTPDFRVGRNVAAIGKLKGINSFQLPMQG